jgi:hypothetical protein
MEIAMIKEKYLIKSTGNCFVSAFVVQLDENNLNDII